jgi:DNA mismatch endonuclease Vsr
VERALRQFLPGGNFINVPPKSSRNLSAVRGRNNKTTELRLRLALVRAGIRGWQLHSAALPGCPDFVFPRQRVAVFVDGCFWHGCPECGHIPKTNSAFWRAKVQRNMERDRNNRLKLQEGRYRVTRIWEHELRSDIGGCVARITALLQ